MSEQKVKHPGYSSAELQELLAEFLGSGGFYAGLAQQKIIELEVRVENQRVALAKLQGKYETVKGQLRQGRGERREVLWYRRHSTKHPAPGELVEQPVTGQGERAAEPDRPTNTQERRTSRDSKEGSA